jgi:hypothetical protein
LAATGRDVSRHRRQHAQVLIVQRAGEAFDLQAHAQGALFFTVEPAAAAWWRGRGRSPAPQ